MLTQKEQTKLASTAKKGNPYAIIIKIMARKVKGPNFWMDDKFKTTEKINEILTDNFKGKVKKVQDKIPLWWEQLERSNRGGKSRLKTVELVGLIMDIYNNRLIYANGAFHKYSKGYWKLVDESEIHSLVYKLDGLQATSGRANAVVNYLKQDKNKGNTKPDLNLICMKNGTYDVEQGKLVPHSPKHMLFNKHKIKWNPKAECPEWIIFLAEVFKGDKEKEQKIEFWRQWFGYSLLPRASKHKWVWLFGEGRNGKGVLLQVLTAIVGKDNTTNLRFKHFSGNYIVSRLQNKLLNITQEVSPGEKLDIGLYKSICAGDRITVDKKNVDGFELDPYCRLMASINPVMEKLPKIDDTSQAFVDRCIIIWFNRIFKEEERDEFLSNNLIQNELEGIFQWSIQGLIDLEKNNGKFKIPKSSGRAIDKFIKQSDQIKLFFEDVLISDAKGQVTVDDLYPTVYDKWRALSKEKPLARNKFGEGMLRLYKSDLVGMTNHSGVKKYKVRVRKKYQK